MSITTLAFNLIVFQNQNWFHPPPISNPSNPFFSSKFLLHALQNPRLHRPQLCHVPPPSIRDQCLGLDPPHPPPRSNTIPQSQNFSFSLSSPNPKFHTFVSFIRRRSKREREIEGKKGCYQQETNTVLIDSMVARTDVSGGGEGRNGGLQGFCSFFSFLVVGVDKCLNVFGF